MRSQWIWAGLLFLGCSSVGTDREAMVMPAALRTHITFEPLNREKANRYIEMERHVHKQNTESLREELAGLQAGRKERYEEISREFPECRRQRHCQSQLSRGSVKRFERFNDLAKELLEYDKRIVVLEASLNDWDRRLELRTRAILNRFVVHEVLQIPANVNSFQGIMAYSLESFDTRKQMSQHLLRYAGNNNLVASVVGDLDFRMFGLPVDEAAVIATFEVYLLPIYREREAPTRYVVTMLVNTHQLDLRFYDKDFMRSWGAKLAEPFQEALRREVFCAMYSISGKTLLPRLATGLAERCEPARLRLQPKDGNSFENRFPPDSWMLPLAYFPIKGGKD